MALRTRIPLIVASVLLVLMVGLYGVLHYLQTRAYKRLETREVEQNLGRVQDAIYNEIERMTSTAGDYAAWDDSYNFILDKNRDFIENNLSSDALLNLKINVMAFFDTKGTLVVANAVDLGSGEERSLTDQEKQLFSDNSAFVLHQSLDGSHQTFATLGHGLLMMVSRPIIKSDYTGPIRGSIVALKYLDSAETARLSHLTHLNFRLCRTDGTVADSLCPAAALAQLTKSDSLLVAPRTRDIVEGYALLKNASNKPVAMLVLTQKREVYRQGLLTLGSFAAAFAVIALTLLIIIILLLETQVLRRLSHLARDIRLIRAHTDLSSRVTLRGPDELGSLAAEMNRMLEAIEAANNDVRENEKKFRLTFESARDAIFWTDPETDAILNCNKEAENLLERPRLDIINMPFKKAFPPEKVQEYVELFRIYIEKNESFETEISLQTAGGKIKHALASGSITWISGKRILQTIARDITRQKEVEKERNQLEEQLRQAQKMEVIGQLAGGVAHDFNNMLAGISGYSDLLRRKFGALDPDIYKFATTIFETSKSAADLTAKLLAFARKGKNELAAVDLHEVVYDVVKLLEHTIDKRIIITQSLNARPATTSGDRNQMQNAVFNLALNACDAMQGGGELSLTTEIVDIDEAYVKANPYKIAQGRYVMVSVTDTGTGMDEKTRAHLFEPFFTTKMPGKGTGLGLASVYGMAKSHNGAISVYSEPGKGSCFKLYLPLLNAASGSAHLVADELAEKGSGHVFLVDDEKLVREVTTDILKDLGYTSASAVDGLDGVEYYKAHWKEIDLVILDIIMPRMDGYDTFVEFKKINPAIRAIVSSGYAMNTEAGRILQQGALAFIQKPFDVSRLSRVIHQALHPAPTPRA